MRIEKDTMGQMELPDDSYYGAQTQRAYQNFQVSNHKIPRPMIAAIAMIKRSAAIVNHNLGLLWQAHQINRSQDRHTKIICTEFVILPRTSWRMLYSKCLSQSVLS